RDIETAEHAAAVGGEQIKALAGDFVCQHDHVERVAAETTVFLGERKTQEAHLDPCLIESIGIGLIAIQPPDILRRRDPVHHLANTVSQDFMLFAEGEIHGRPYVARRLAFFFTASWPPIPGLYKPFMKSPIPLSTQAPFWT